MSQRRATGNRFPYVGVVEMLRRAFDGHINHRFTQSFDDDDPEIACVYCHDCDEPVVQGTRELIELVWLDAMTGPPTAH